MRWWFLNKLLKWFALTHMDLWERWTIPTKKGKLFVDLGWRPVDGAKESYYNELKKKGNHDN